MESKATKGAKNREAKSFLSQIQKFNALIRNKEIEKEIMRGIALSVTAYSSGERVQSSGNPQKMANAVEKCVDAEADIARAVDALTEARKSVVSVIEQLPPVEYDVLHRKYVQGQTYEDIADDYGKSYSWATTTHDRAVDKVQRIIMTEGVCGK